MSSPEPRLSGLGIFSGLTMHAYLKHPGISAGFLSRMKRSPAHARYDFDHPKASTEAMDTGSLVDAMILDFVDLRGRFVIRPPEFKDWRTSKSQEWRDEQERNGKIVVTLDQWTRALAMKDALWCHPNARDLLWHENRRCQESIFWVDDVTDLYCKARPDCWIDRVIVNLKSTADARPHAFSRTAENFGYWLGAAHYLAGAYAVTGTEHIHCWVVVEQEPPHGVRIYSTHGPDGFSAALLAAEMEWREAMNAAAACFKSGVWAGYPISIETLKRPRWALERDINE